MVLKIHIISKKLLKEFPLTFPLVIEHILHSKILRHISCENDHKKLWFVFCLKQECVDHIINAVKVTRINILLEKTMFGFFYINHDKYSIPFQNTCIF